MLKFHSLRVLDVRPEAEDAILLTLHVPPALEEEFRARAGQHIVVRAPGVDDQRRTYSLINAAGELPLRIAVRVHQHAGFSRWLAEHAREGTMLDVMPPNGSFGAHDGAADGGIYVAFASGCGITPVISIVRTLLARNDRARVVLFYGNRNRARTMLLEELLALKDRYLDRLAVHFLMTGEPQEIELLNGRLDADKVRALVTAGLFRPEEIRQSYVCGPGSMIAEVTRTLTELGVEPARIHSEHFTVSGTETRTKPAAPAGATVDSGSIQVAVTMDGRRRTFTMDSTGESIIDAAARAGIDLPFSCKAGVCSTCRTKLLKGEVELAENYALEDWELEQGYILACQARPKSTELELDYDAG